MKTKDIKQTLTVLKPSEIACVAGGKKLNQVIHDLGDVAKDVGKIATNTFVTVVSGVTTVAMFMNFDNIIHPKN